MPPLNIPSATGGADDKYDDFTHDAVAWTLAAHEARPGHELQCDAMVEHGVSLARARFAFNSTNVEGWGLYAEYIMQPYEAAARPDAPGRDGRLRADAEMNGNAQPARDWTTLSAARA